MQTLSQILSNVMCYMTLLLMVDTGPNFDITLLFAV